MKHAAIVILTGFFLLFLTRVYSQFDFNSGNSIYATLSNYDVPLPDILTSAPENIYNEITPAGEKKWTVMVFINGKNDLEGAGLYNVNMMETVGSTRDMNIVVELGRMKGQQGDTDIDGDWTGVRRLLIKKDADPKKITSTVVMTAEKADMGDYKRVVDFVAWAKKNYPAKRYLLILWDHGTGWLDPRQTKNDSVDKGISYDDETNNYIRTQQIGQILKETGKVDILGFDACLMQTAEVAYEVKDYTEVIVGSEEVVPGLGYPYSLFLGIMATYPDMPTEETGAVMVEAFKKLYDTINQDAQLSAKIKKDAQLSAIRSSKIEDMGTKLSEFSKLAREVGDTEALNSARSRVIRYDVLGSTVDPNMTISFYGDLPQYVSLVADGATKDHDKTADLKAKADELRDFIARELVIHNRASGKNRLGRDLAESSGISIYLPPVETRVAQNRLEYVFEGKYADFAFNKATGWHDFVTYLYGVK